MSLDLRPLTLGELLDRSFSLYRRHFWLFVGIMALPSLLGLAFGVLVALFNPQPGSPGSAAPDANPAEILGAVLWFAGAMIGMLVIYFITSAVALGATTVAVSSSVSTADVHTMTQRTGTSAPLSSHRTTIIL